MLRNYPSERCLNIYNYIYQQYYNSSTATKPSPEPRMGISTTNQNVSWFYHVENMGKASSKHGKTGIV